MRTFVLQLRPLRLWKFTGKYLYQRVTIRQEEPASYAYPIGRLDYSILQSWGTQLGVDVAFGNFAESFEFFF